MQNENLKDKKIFYEPLLSHEKLEKMIKSIEIEASKETELIENKNVNETRETCKIEENDESEMIDEFEKPAVFPQIIPNKMILTNETILEYKLELSKMFDHVNNHPNQNIESFEIIFNKIYKVYRYKCICLNYIQNKKTKVNHILKLKLLNFVWKDLIYPCIKDFEFIIEKLRLKSSLSDSDNNNYKKVSELYISLIRTALSFYNEILEKLKLFYKVKDNKDKIKKLISRWIFETLIRIGDIYRYGYEFYKLYNDNLSNERQKYLFNKVIEKYSESIIYAPFHPKVYYQLGMVNFENKNFFDGFYNFIKSIIYSFFVSKEDILLSCKERLKLQCLINYEELQKWSLKYNIPIIEKKEFKLNAIITNEVWCLDINNERLRKVLTENGDFKIYNDKTFNFLKVRELFCLKHLKNFEQLLLTDLNMAKNFFMLHFLYIHGNYLSDTICNNQQDIEELWILIFEKLIYDSNIRNIFTLDFSFQILLINFYTLHDQLLKCSLKVDETFDCYKLKLVFNFFLKYFDIICNCFISEFCIGTVTNINTSSNLINNINNNINNSSNIISNINNSLISDINTEVGLNSNKLVMETCIFEKYVFVIIIVIDWFLEMTGDNSNLNELQRQNLKNLFIYMTSILSLDVLIEKFGKISEMIKNLIFKFESEYEDKNIDFNELSRFKMYYFGGFFEKIDPNNLFFSDPMKFNKTFNKHNALLVLEKTINKFIKVLKTWLKESENLCDSVNEAKNKNDKHKEEKNEIEIKELPFDFSVLYKES